MAYVGQDGTSGYVRSQGVAVNTIQNWTMMCWCFVETTSEKGAFFYIGVDQNNAGDGMGLYVGANNGGALGNKALGTTFPVAWLDANTSFGTGWHHFAMVDRGGFQYLYLDGISLGGFASPITSAPDTLTQLGCDSDPDAGSNLSAGNRTAHAKAWNSALGTTQIQAEMSSGFPMFNFDTLAMYWSAEKSGGYGTANVIDFTQKLSAIGIATNTVTWADNPPVARC